MNMDWSERYYNGRFIKRKRMTYEEARDVILKRKYGITFSILTDTINKQKGCCLGCGQKCKLFPDHDHKTGRFRGMLCHNCNVGLGQLQDNVKIMRNLIHYLTHPIKTS